MSLTAKDVAEILKALDSSSFDTLDLEMNGVKVSLRRGASGSAEADRAAAAPRLAPTAQQPAPHADAAQQRSSTPAAAQVAAPAGTIAVPAPLLGIFYHAPKPGEPPFVHVGARVAEDSIIGIIEVMKLMNTVRAGVRGEIVAMPAPNGELVEFGAPLLFVRPA